MPKPDGTLYWYEKEKLEAANKPKVKKPAAKRVGSTKAVGVTKALQADTTAEDSSQELSSDCDNTDSSNVVSINGGEPIKKRMGPKPGHSNHPLQPPKGKAGRPTVRVKATPELIEAICASIRGGLSIESSCILQGIARSGIDRWRKINPTVNAKFEKAESEFERDILGHITTKAPVDVKAATWLLERGRPQRWAQVSKNELTGKDGKPMPSLSIAKSLVGSMSVKGDPSTKVKVAV